METGTLYITGDAAADRLLNTSGDGTAHRDAARPAIPMEWAFAGPATLQARLGHLDATIVAVDGRTRWFARLCARSRRSTDSRHRSAADPRAVHRVGRTVRRRRDPGLVRSSTMPSPCATRLRELPGYGDEKTKIFVAILAKRMGVRPGGWQQVAGVRR